MKRGQQGQLKIKCYQYYFCHLLRYLKQQNSHLKLAYFYPNFHSAFLRCQKWIKSIIQTFNIYILYLELYVSISTYQNPKRSQTFKNTFLSLDATRNLQIVLLALTTNLTLKKVMSWNWELNKQCLILEQTEIRIPR